MSRLSIRRRFRWDVSANVAVVSERLRRGLTVGATAGVMSLWAELAVAPAAGLRLWLAATLLGGGFGALAGVFVAAILPSLSSRRAWLLCGLTAPALAYAALHVFDGPRAQRIPGRTALAIAFLLLALASLRLFLGWYLRRRRPAWGFVWITALLVLVYVDQHVLARLYPWFHVELALAGWAAAGLTAAAWLRRSHWFPLVVIGLVLPSLWWVDSDRPSRLFALAHLPSMGRAVGLWRRARAKAVVTVVTKNAVAAPQDWPRLGDADLILVTIDAWRADRLNATITPRIDGLRREGIEMERAYTEVPHTSFAVATIMTGRHVAAELAVGTSPAAMPTLAGILRNEKYKTAAFYPPSVFYVDRARLEPFEKSGYDFEYVKREYLDAAHRTDQVIAFFEAEAPRRAFVWVHYLEPHEPYEAHPGITAAASSDEARYDGEVRAVDAEVGRLVDWLGAHRGRAVVAITADHGEEFNEHGGRYHGTTLYEEQIRVPWILVSLGLEPRLAPGRVPGPVSLVDLAPTFLTLLDVARPPGMKPFGVAGRLPPAARSDGNVPPVFAEIGSQHAIVDGTDKLICDLAVDSCQLFDLARDPHELSPRVDGDAVEARLRAQLIGFAADQAATAPDPTSAWLARAKQGDPTALAKLPSLLAPDQPLSVRRMAARGAIDLPRVPPLSLSTDADPALARLGRLLRARAGERLADEDLDFFCNQAEQNTDAPLCARAALSTGSVPRLAQILPRLDDETLALEVIDRLGRSGDDRAFQPLVLRLETVRTRRQTVEALEHLGRREIIETFARWAPSDPYQPVRVAMAHALGSLATTQPAAIAALETLRAETDPGVHTAACAALVKLGQRRCTDDATHSK